MDELAKWLGEQLDEEYAEAEEALRRTTATRRRIGGQWVEDTVQPPEWRRSVWPPARVLREIDAKRQALQLYEDSTTALMAASGTVLAGGVKVRRRAYGDVLKLLALPYADRPGYREEWRP